MVSIILGMAASTSCLHILSYIEVLFVEWHNNAPFHEKHKTKGCNHCLKFRQFCKSGVCNQSLVSSLIHEKPQ